MKKKKKVVIIVITSIIFTIIWKMGSIPSNKQEGKNEKSKSEDKQEEKIKKKANSNIPLQPVDSGYYAAPLNSSVPPLIYQVAPAQIYPINPVISANTPLTMPIPFNHHSYQAPISYSTNMSRPQKFSPYCQQNDYFPSPNPPPCVLRTRPHPHHGGVNNASVNSNNNPRLIKHMVYRPLGTRPSRGLDENYMKNANKPLGHSMNNNMNERKRSKEIIYYDDEFDDEDDDEDSSEYEMTENDENYDEFMDLNNNEYITYNNSY